MYEAHDALKMYWRKKKLLMIKIDLNIATNTFLKNTKEIEKLYSDIPEALENNYNFHLRFSFKPKKSKPILPSMANNQKNSPENELLKQAKEGLDNQLIISF